ncbi:hypothetical protein BG910_07140 [Neisseria chenwenguii]|uniref:Uncharacterized protein n=1 Tax=Neisseria chenwenguii TaxID=1853278 RepID=A0A220S242_9NEIS|nr:hypothetical protein BG910_07140 [Neisseria chenwenguii]ROV55627.1 hypothetical protein EGS38_08985 [Neisseria chenwenguii]
MCNGICGLKRCRLNLRVQTASDWSESASRITEAAAVHWRADFPAARHHAAVAAHIAVHAARVLAAVVVDVVDAVDAGVGAGAVVARQTAGSSETTQPDSAVAESTLMTPGRTGIGVWKQSCFFL